MEIFINDTVFALIQKDTEAFCLFRRVIIFKIIACETYTVGIAVRLFAALIKLKLFCMNSELNVLKKIFFFVKGLYFFFFFENSNQIRSKHLIMKTELAAALALGTQLFGY